MSKEIVKVLIAVDVQNCFIHGGTLGTPSGNSSTTYFRNLENVLDNTKEHNKHLAADSIKQTNQILKLMEGKDIVVITRDSHPDNHSSFRKGRPHCRKSKISKHQKISSCTERVQGGNLSTYGTEREEIIGTNPSMLYKLVAQQSGKYQTLVDKIYNCDVTLGLADLGGNQNQSPENVIYELSIKNEKTEDLPLFIDVRKGEICSYDSFSAFMYHVDATGNPNLDVRSEYSTMLMETLLSSKIMNMIKKDVRKEFKFEIEVCGLVGNICVMFTASYGIGYYNKIKNVLSNKPLYGGFPDSFEDKFKQFKTKYDESLRTFQRQIDEESNSFKIIQNKLDKKRLEYNYKRTFGLHDDKPVTVNDMSFTFYGRNGTRWLRYPGFGYTGSESEAEILSKETDLVETEIKRLNNGTLHGVTVDFN